MALWRSKSLSLVSALDLTVARKLLLKDPTILAMTGSDILSNRHYSDSNSNRKPGSRLGQTSVFLQTGLKIRELPLVVKKVNDVLKISGMDKYKDVIEPVNPANDIIPAYPPKLDDQEQEVIAGFNRCISVQGIFRLLETIPAEEVTPPVAIHTLKKIIDLENNSNIRNPHFRETLHGKMANLTDNKSNETFLRIAFINMLLDIVYRSRDPNVIVEGLKIVSRDTFPDEQSAYKERMVEETLVCISEGIFNLKQICESVVILADFYEDKRKCHDLADKLWSGILDKANQINAETISSVFATLPHLKSSRDIILKLVENAAGEFWQDYRIGNVLEILKVMTQLNSSNEKVLKVISQWLKVNIHKLNENETLAVIYCFHKLDYIDDTVISTMERYMKVRGCQIRERDLVATICDYCLDFRVQSRPILEGVCEYFIEHSKTLSTPQIYSITQIFGELNFHPPNGFRFWELVENVLEQKFIEFPPKEIIDLFLSYIYIERYPLNFVRKIFNPYFLDRLHNQTEDDVMYSRTQLKLFDCSMKLESRNYGGPYLPKQTNYRTIHQDQQVLRLATSLVQPFGEVVGDMDRIGKSVVLSSLPLHPLYIADLMIYPSVAASLLRFGKNTNNSRNIAVLIHPKEHYIRFGAENQTLIGPQALRVRQLKKMGFRVLEIEAEHVRKLNMHDPKLKQYLGEKYYQVLGESS